MRNRKVKTVISVLVILALGVLGMRVISGLGEKETVKPPPPNVRVVKSSIVQTADIQAQISAFGKLSSAQPVVLTSEVSGEMLPGTVPFRRGQRFRKGDLLLKIDERQALLDLNSAKSQLLNALAAVLPELRVDFQEDYHRWQEYFDSFSFEKNLDELPEVKNPRIKLFLSRFDVYTRYFAVKDLEINVEKYYFYTPFSGTILFADLHIGSSVRSGTKLGEILNLQQMELEVPIPAADIVWLNQGEPVVLSTTELPGVWDGEIKRIGQFIDERTQTIPVFVQVRDINKGRLYNGLLMRAEFAGNIITHAARIPQHAVHEGQSVYLIQNGRLHLQPVEIIRREKTNVIARGLSAGDTLVTELLQGVAPGMLAKARNDDSTNGAYNE